MLDFFRVKEHSWMAELMVLVKDLISLSISEVVVVNGLAVTG